VIAGGHTEPVHRADGALKDTTQTIRIFELKGGI
jgi:hypothetical protein